jgi:hypothetical protein
MASGRAEPQDDWFAVGARIAPLQLVTKLGLEGPVIDMVGNKQNARKLNKQKPFANKIF